MPNNSNSVAIPRYRSDALTPEIVDPRLADVEALARWLDYAFTLPGGFQFGVAGIVGLIPGIGDVMDAVLSMYIIMRAVKLRIPRVAVARMLVNVGIESLAGTVPVIGNLFDVAFKANRRNYHLLKSHLSQPERQRKSDWWFILLTLALLVVSIGLPIWGLVEVFKLFAKH
jgi:hypothetical protein